MYVLTLKGISFEFETYIFFFNISLFLKKNAKFATYY